MHNTLVIFGASGDLTRRKLVPALYQLHRKGRLPQATRIVGFSRTGMSDDAWRDALATSLRGFDGESFDQRAWNDFAQGVFYCPGDLSQIEDIQSLKSRLGDLTGGGPCATTFYLATAPQHYATAIRNLGQAGLPDRGSCTTRVVIEKPFGTDRTSAEALNRLVHEVFDEGVSTAGRIYLCGKRIWR